ncbi:MAG: leucyl aminopeptidase family protein [Bacteroidota bacterium]
MRLNTSNEISKDSALIIVDANAGEFFNPESPEYYAATGLGNYEHRAFYTADGRQCYLLKLNPSESNYGKTLEAARLLAHKSNKNWPQKIVVDSLLKSADDIRLQAVVEGLSLGQYQIGKWKSQEVDKLPDIEITPLYFGKTIKDSEDREDALRILSALEDKLILADIEKKIMDLVNAPANQKRPQMLADWAKESAHTYGYDVHIYHKAACEKMGLHALLAVNRGSEDGAHFIVMEYRHKDAPEGGPTALIGKGVTFDTGGISLKRPTNMHLMKSDMGGAAAVLGTMEGAARLQLPIHLVGIVPATDNSIDALSIKPSDVIQSYSGKTIEIIDTDAEGRLIMSDALAYAVENYKPSRLMSIATLTGSAVRTFGYECAALFSKDQNMVSALMEAGERVGQRCWPLPPWDEYRPDLDSDVADIANLSNKPIAGAIAAFKFLEFFTAEHPSYVHLDIAGVALKAGPYAKDRQATAFGPRLLLDWLSL